MIIRTALRAIAVAIAIAGVIDPTWSRTVTHEPPVVAVNLTSADTSAIQLRLRDSLKGREVIVRAPAMHRLPCGRAEDCVVIADGSVDAEPAGDAERPLSMIVSRPDGTPNVAIKSVTVTSGHQAASGVARIELTAEGVQGRTTELRIIDGPAIVGTASHSWTASSAATIDVPWWPLGAGARALRVEAVAFDGEQSTIDNVIDVGVAVATDRASVMVFDARPSWTSTFVRRALEDDGRFSVRYRARVAPALTVGSTGAALEAATLDAMSAVVVGGPDALAQADVTLIDRYDRVRGGTLVLLPEQKNAGAAASLLHGTWTERLTATAEAIGPLRASETLRMTNAPVAATVIGRSGTAPAIVSVPAGAGRIIVSGAMDAWRYRQGGEFDRFWRTLLAEGAQAGQGLSIRLARTVTPVGSRVRFTLSDRRMDAQSSAEGSATIRCNDSRASAIRLWPSGSIGEFDGELPASATGQCTVEAIIGDRVTTGAIAVTERVAPGVDQTLFRLSEGVHASGGVVVWPGHEGSAVRTLLDRPPMSSVVSVRPMHSSWWMLPFAACLTAEWWLRRRGGLK